MNGTCLYCPDMGRVGTHTEVQELVTTLKCSLPGNSWSTRHGTPLPKDENKPDRRSRIKTNKE